MRRLTIALAVITSLVVVPVVGYSAFVTIDSRTFQGQKNVSGAMDPTLLTGEVFLSRGIDGDARLGLARGTIVLHTWPVDTTKLFIKRVVGLPGDTIEMVSGALRVNGVAIAEPYAWRSDSTVDPAPEDFRWQRAYLVGAAKVGSVYRPSRDNWGPIAVPARNYFVLGDNRDNSLDSRYWGFLPVVDVKGLPRRIYYSSDPKTGRIRWARLGHRLQ
jgi:signal peptidase I